MVSARQIQKVLLRSNKLCLSLTILVLAAALTTPPITRAAVGSPQICAPASTCVVGEFLYDDSYTPIPDAECKLTSKYPNGTEHLTDQIMSKTADGWYSYEFTAPSTTGYYRTQVCCTAGSDYLCVDKSFEVKSSTDATANEVATAVWGYSGRTLTSFGTIASDVWSSSSRSLSSFGNLVSDVWNNTTRTLTGTNLSSGNLATKSDVTNLKTALDENKNLLEKLVNKPIIENILEEVEDKDLSEKIDQTKSVAAQLYINHQFLTSKAGLTVSKWDKLSDRELLDAFIEISEVLGEEGDTSSSSSFLGNLSWLREVWGWSQADDLYDQAKAIKKTVAFIQGRISSYGKSKTLYNEAKSLLVYLRTSEKFLGDSGDEASARTVFGKLKETEQLALALDERIAEVDKYLVEAKKPDPLSFRRKVEDLIKRVLAINKLPRASAVLSAKTKDISAEKKIKNQLLSTKGLLMANKRLLANGEGKTLSATWLEEGSIVVKTLVTNPSTVISQEVALKYYLPEEIKRQEDILEADDGLSVKFDTEKNQYYIEGKLTLKPGETKTVSVRLQDVWTLKQEQIDSLRKQAAELSRPLEKTSYFAQGVTLKSDIDVSLDRVEALIEEVITPEQKIKAYREAEIELAGVKTKMEKLQELVTMASGAGSLLGFVGGSQAIAVWGIIIVVAAGFIFLSLAMRMIARGINNDANNNGANNNNANNITKEDKHAKKKEKMTKGGGMTRIFKLALPLILATVISATVSASLASSLILLSEKAHQEKDSPEATPIKEEENKVLGLGVGGVEIVRLNAPEDGEIVLYSQPSTSSAIKMRLESGQEVVKTGEEGNWVQILIIKNISPESILEGWVEKDFVKGAEEENQESPSLSVTIKNTPTGWLRVREKPGGKEIGRVYPGEEYKFIGQESGWYQIEFEGGEAWISGSWAEINE